MPATTSLRLHANLQQMILNCQQKHAEDEELDLYLQIAPENEARVRAAREIREVETPIVRKVVKRIFEVYPYEQHHELAVTKATRDVKMVVLYAALAMLVGDPQWMRDKLLLWMRSILNSFRFPDKLPNREYIYQSDPRASAKLQKLKPHQRSVYETFLLCRDEMQRALSREAYAEIETYLNLAVDTLSIE